MPSILLRIVALSNLEQFRAQYRTNHMNISRDMLIRTLIVHKMA